MSKKILREMMEELDEVADQIPEGFYLKMCDCAKRMHETLPPTPTAYMAGRRCGLCRELGHDRRSCPGRRRLITQPESAPRPVVHRRGGCFPNWFRFW